MRALTSLVSSLTALRYSSLVSHVDQAETKLVSAMLHALRKPSGPTHLSFPVDILRSLVMPKTAGHGFSALLRNRPCLIDERAVDALHAELLAASRSRSSLATARRRRSTRSTNWSSSPMRFS